MRKMRLNMLSKKIGFLGINSYDMIAYLTRILVKLETIKNGNIACIDATLDKSLVGSIPNIEGYEHVIDYRGIDYLLDDKISKIKQEEYQYIFYDFGKNKHHKQLNECGVLYLVTDLQKQNIEFFQNLNIDLRISLYVIIRDVVPGKINEKYVIHQMQQYGNSILKSYIIKFDYIDYSNKLIMQHNNIFKFNRLSNSYKDVLIDMVEQLCEEVEQNSSILKALKKAEKGE